MSLLQVYFRALRYLAADKKRTFFICAANIVLSLVVIAEPILFGRVIDAITEKRDVVPTLALWAGLGGFNIIAFVLVARGADRLAHSLRAEVLVRSYERVIAMPLSWHMSRGTSNSLHTLVRAVDSLQALWLEFLRTQLGTAVTLVLLVPTALAMDVRMSCVLLVLGIVYVAIGRLVMRKTKQGQQRVEQHHHNVFAHVSDTIGNVSVVQGYNRVAIETESLRNHFRKLLSAQNPVLDWWALASALNRLSATISMMVVLVIGSYLVMRGELPVGSIIAFTGFANLLIARLDQITNFVNQIFDARVKLEDFYAMEEAAALAEEPADLAELTNVDGRVVFDGVTFHFENSGQGVENVSFAVEPGQTVAIVGPTGAGKTTLINLLQRVNDPQGGRILIDGVDISTVTRRSLRQSIATVFQDAGLFNRSIESNIRVGRDDASLDEVRNAAVAASAQDFIAAKSDGYDTVAGERGGQLSGGERQRIAIARAMLKDAPILVLDEATSALDVETEERVKVAIDGLRANRTTFVIAHRLSTVRDADLVIFMDSGRVVEMGGFDELAAKGGRFASLLRAGGLLTETTPKHALSA
ncbi:MAG: glucan ABC transporter ATP-binding protein/ permease [Rhizobiaceae bacterium]|nr:glucan ABC transporter ATP-binding protein/ permease [Rhizobiaceae bacterium]